MNAVKDFFHTYQSQLLIGFGILCALGVLWYFLKPHEPFDSELMENYEDMNYEGFGDGLAGGDGYQDGEQKKTLKVYFADWCGHCEELLKAGGIWEQLKQKHSSVDFKELNGDQHADEVTKLGVEGYPAIFLVSESGATQQFKGNRTLEELSAFLQ
jgi:thiol-disulfide isomerase/thioredoxin